MHDDHVPLQAVTRRQPVSTLDAREGAHVPMHNVDVPLQIERLAESLVALVALVALRSVRVTQVVSQVHSVREHLPALVALAPLRRVANFSMTPQALSAGERLVAGGHRARVRCRTRVRSFVILQGGSLVERLVTRRK